MDEANIGELLAARPSETASTGIAAGSTGGMRQRCAARTGRMRMTTMGAILVHPRTLSDLRLASSRPSRAMFIR